LQESTSFMDFPQLEYELSTTKDTKSTKTK
jgi:hypothetical protein